MKKGIFAGIIATSLLGCSTVDNTEELVMGQHSTKQLSFKYNTYTKNGATFTVELSELLASAHCYKKTVDFDDWQKTINWCQTIWTREQNLNNFAVFSNLDSKGKHFFSMFAQDIRHAIDNTDLDVYGLVDIEFKKSVSGLAKR